METEIKAGSENDGPGSLERIVRRLEFDIEPEQGAAAMFGMCALKGHKLVRMERNGRKVVCEYEKVA